MQSEHPSPEALNAYFDSELPPEDRIPLETHFEGCPECRTSLRAFEALAGLAPELDPALPGDAYWTDLPDRILARITANPAPAVLPAGGGFWARLRRPEGFWRYAVGATAVAAVAVGAWAVLLTPTASTPPPGSIRSNFPSAGTIPQAVPVTPASDDYVRAAGRASVPEGMIADLNPMSPIGAPLFIPSQGQGGESEPVVDQSGPSISPGSFIRRSWVTLGNGANVGTSLDIPSPSTTSGLSSSGYPTGIQVAESLPPLGPDYRHEADGVVGYGCGVDTLELAFTSALKAEEDGNYRLAAVGYRSVKDASRPGSRLYHAADYRLNVIVWRDRVQRAYTSEQQRAQVLAELQSQMSQAIATWERTRNTLDCQKAECMTRVFLTLGPEVINPEHLSGPRADLQNFKRCSD